MKISTTKWMAGVAIATTACVSFAQSPNNPNVVAPEGPKEASVPAEGKELGRSYVAPDMSRNCAGLSDRQTERACKEGYPTQHSDQPNSMGTDRGGQTDDQAS
jgi:hypothetical protein